MQASAPTTTPVSGGKKPRNDHARKKPPADHMTMFARTISTVKNLKTVTYLIVIFLPKTKYFTYHCHGGGSQYNYFSSQEILCPENLTRW